MKKVCNKLKDKGISIAMDDFGTGYSSLGYLSKLSIDILKIDKTFINDLDKNQSNRDIFLDVIKMTHSLDLKITAEGSESDIQYDFLK